MCLINYFKGMQSIDELSGSSELNSTEQKVYSCFCQKLFATYPGIYQHLKSKHPNVFPTYKKRKIKKMLRKSRDSRGNQAYKLIKLPDALIRSLQAGNQQKNGKEHIQEKVKKCNSVQPSNNIMQNSKVPVESTQKQNQSNKAQPQNPNRSKNSKNPDVLTQNDEAMPEPFMNYPGEMPPYMSPFPQYSPPCMFPYYYPPFSPQYWLTTKALLRRFLYQAPDFDKELMGSHLYKLMVFIDKNYREANDPRIEERLFLSYCDQFDPRYLGKLVSDYNSNLESQFQQKKLSFSEEESKEKMLEIDCLKTFALWLHEAGLLKLESKRQSEVKPSENEVEARENLVIE